MGEQSGGQTGESGEHAIGCLGYHDNAGDCYTSARGDTSRGQSGRVVEPSDG